jgi:hypothetical protein
MASAREMINSFTSDLENKEDKWDLHAANPFASAYESALQGFKETIKAQEADKADLELALLDATAIRLVLARRHRDARCRPLDQQRPRWRRHGRQVGFELARLLHQAMDEVARGGGQDGPVAGPADRSGDHRELGDEGLEAGVVEQVLERNGLAMTADEVSEKITQQHL